MSCNFFCQGLQHAPALIIHFIPNQSIPAMNEDRSRVETFLFKMLLNCLSYVCHF